MSRNGVVEDEEAQFGGNRIQPFSSTPTQGQRKVEEENKQILTSQGMKLGLEDLFSLQVWRASVAELLGSAVLVFTIDTIVISMYESETKSPNLMISILVAFTVAILVLAAMPVSGGHISPVITFSAALAGLISFSRGAIYIVAQCVGAILGALALKVVVSSTIEQAFSLGGCTLTIIAPGPDGPITIGIEMGRALWLEIFSTFVFLYASVWIAFDAHRAKTFGSIIVCSIIGIAVGLVLFISTTVTAKKGYAGAGMNPARCLGPAIVRGGHLWKGHWVFWAGPSIACVAFFLFLKIIPQAQEY